jgi:DNA-binding winged helix-turn-helix (wHTH) protein
MQLHKPTIFAFAAYVYDAENRRLTRNRVPIRINKQMLDLLDLLIRNGGRLVTREQIQSTLWPDQFVENREKQITNAISRLRHILGDDPAKPRYIKSIPRTGYRLIAKINPVEASTKEPAPAVTSALPVPPEAVNPENGPSNFRSP